MPSTSTIDPNRLEQVTNLSAGSHAPDSQYCVMEAAAFIAGESWSDAPECVCPTITTFLVNWNDALPSDAERNRLLLPLLPSIINTRGSGELSRQRAWMCLDWLIRVHTTRWLRLAGLHNHADALAALPEITKRTELAPVGQKIDAAWDAARAAAGAALAPVVTELQQSAVDHVQRMAALRDADLPRAQPHRGSGRRGTHPPR